MAKWRLVSWRTAPLLLFGMSTIAVASCTDQSGILEPSVPPPPNHGPSGLSQTVQVVAGARGEVPGRRTMTLGFTDKTTAKDSVWWPDSFPVATRVKMTVNGRITRNYNPDIWPSLNLAGLPYFAIDADGEFISSSCYGMIATDFRTAPSVGGLNLHGCRTGTYSNPNFPPQDAATEHATIGVAKGYGYVRRIGFGQPSYPSTQYCGVWPTARCVWANPGSQDITIEPTATLLTLTATPDSIDAGALVLFQPAASGLSYSVKAWIWVPDEPPTVIMADALPPTSFLPKMTSALPSGPGFPSAFEPLPHVPDERVKLGHDLQIIRPKAAAAMLDSRTVYCTLPSTNCQIPIFQSGTMYVRATVGSGGSAILEQASAHVEVALPTLIAACDEDPGTTIIRIYPVQCTAKLSDPTLPFAITLRRAVADDSIEIEEAGLSIAIDAGDKDYWDGTRAVETKVSFEATVMVAGAPVPLPRSNEAVFHVTPRLWPALTIPTLAPITWISQGVSDSARTSIPVDRTMPQPYPGFAISSKSGTRDRIITGGVAVYNYGGPEWQIEQIDDGPNKGYKYVATMPTLNTGEVRVLESLKEGNSFFGRQSSATKLPGENNPPAPYSQYCESSTMVGWRQKVFEHEGAATGPSASHHSAARTYLLAHPVAAFFESLVYYREATAPAPDSTVTKLWDTNYMIPMKTATAHTDSGGPVTKVDSLPCKLRP